jgi:hypothetical protein
LQPLDEEETKEYIRYRLARAGGSGIFTPSAPEKIYACTQGVPRRINAWCDLALVAAFAEGRKEIDREFLETVVTAQGETLEGPDRDESGSEEGLSPAPEEQGEQSAREFRLESMVLDLTCQLVPALTKLSSHLPPESPHLASPPSPSSSADREPESLGEETPPTPKGSWWSRLFRPLQN